ncbi:hypothetical protein BSKO_10373 [Bryopsis sp. KO-2023]|nr:hypothetical protein BSKO_10373 [Bryopsis sp. KO-2023]
MPSSNRINQDDIIQTIETRVAIWTRLPKENQESMQVLHYEIGQKYDSHWDWFKEQPQFKEELHGGNRIATVVMYLKDVEEGGETVFQLGVDRRISAKTNSYFGVCKARGSCYPQKAPPVDPKECKDYNVSCEQWAKEGECKSNPGYMVGDGGSLGQCRFSCKTCKPCSKGDPNCKADGNDKILSPEEFISL